MAQLVDLSRLSVDEAVKLQAQKYAARLQQGALLGKEADGDAGSKKPCASCSRIAAGRHSSPHGPWHCNACWGKLLPGEDVPAARPHWWTSHEPWFSDLQPDMQKATVRVIPQVSSLEVLTDPGNGHFPGVGAEKMWPAATRLVEFLFDPEVFTTLRGQVCIELGAGCGVPGMLLACKGMQVHLTDLPWLLPLTELNVAANFDDDDPQRPSVAALRWGCAADVRVLPAPPDLILGADVVYVLEDLPPLFETLEDLHGPVSQVIFSIQHRGSSGAHDSGIRQAFEAKARACGWQLTPGKTRSRGSYSDSRCSVFLLSRAPHPEKLEPLPAPPS